MRFAKSEANKASPLVADASTPLPRPNAAEELERTRVLQIETVLAGNAQILLTGILGSFLMALAVWMNSDRDSPRSHWPWVWWGLLALGLGRGAWMAFRFNASSHTAQETLHEGDRRLGQPINPFKQMGEAERIVPDLFSVGRHRRLQLG